MDRILKEASAKHPRSQVGTCERAYLRMLRERLEWMEARTP